MASDQGLRFEPLKYIRKYSKVFFFRTSWPRYLKFDMYHCLVVLYQVCSNEGPRVQDGPGSGVLGSNHRNT